jgi:hypothetical protein
MLKQGMCDKLKANFERLKRAFTPVGSQKCVIDGFDIDCEEFIEPELLVVFCEMLFDLGFSVSFCPYENVDFWKKCTQQLWAQKKKVSSWRLQCYSGGSPNLNPREFQKWIVALKEIFNEDSAAALLLPGLGVKGYAGTAGDCPDSCKTQFAAWKKSGIGGGWVWRYDETLTNKQPCKGPATLAAYAKAIRDALTPPK